jgi:hypothetical protein
MGVDDLLSYDAGPRAIAQIDESPEIDYSFGR